MAEKSSVTIGIPAHDEQANIGHLLNNLIKQTRKNWSLDKIVVLCDGCTDATAKIATSLSRRHKFIKVIDDGRWLGRGSRTRQLYRLSQSDITLVFDADVLPENVAVIDHLVAPFVDPDVVFVCADRKPLPAITLVEDLINIWDELWARATRTLKRGHNVYHTYSCAVGLRTDFARQVSLPKGLVSEARYLYFKALSSGKKFRFVSQSAVWYRSPAIVSDYVRRINRASGQRRVLKSEFGKLIDDEYLPIGLSAKVGAAIYSFLRHPIKLPLTVILHVYLQSHPRWEEEFTKLDRWTTIPSTKKLIL